MVQWIHHSHFKPGVTGSSKASLVCQIDFKLWPRLRITLAVGRTLNTATYDPNHHNRNLFDYSCFKELFVQAHSEAGKI